MMRDFRKSLFGTLIISIIVVSDTAHADTAPIQQMIVSYDSGYYIAMGLVLIVVVGVSIFILRRLNKEGQLEKGKHSEKKQPKEDKIGPQEGQLISVSRNEIQKDEGGEKERVGH